MRFFEVKNPLFGLVVDFNQMRVLMNDGFRGIAGRTRINRIAQLFVFGQNFYIFSHFFVCQISQTIDVALRDNHQVFFDAVVVPNVVAEQIFNY